ncbi:MAG: helical backbone metal receptor [Planctomycetes bacterium]|nr:helical backbone metal receptor [Planctomycetota bacterium]
MRQLATTASLCFAAIGACGQDQTLAKQPEMPNHAPRRVVVIGPSSAETLDWLGLSAHIVGVSDYCSAPAFNSLPRVGGQLDPNLEQVAALEPDLVITQGVIPKLESWCARSNVYYLHFKTQSVADWRAEAQVYGAWFKLDDTQVRLDAWDERYAKAGVSTNADQLLPRVLIVVSRDAERIARLLVAGRGSYLGELLEHAGGQSLFADHSRDYFDLAEEALLQLQPEIILELSGQQSDRERQELWAKSFPELPAVQSGRVYGLTEDYVFLPGPRMLETVRLLQEKLLFGD